MQIQHSLAPIHSSDPAPLRPPPALSGRLPATDLRTHEHTPLTQKLICNENHKKNKKIQEHPPADQLVVTAQLATTDQNSHLARLPSAHGQLQQSPSPQLSVLTARLSAVNTPSAPTAVPQQGPKFSPRLHPDPSSTETNASRSQHEPRQLVNSGTQRSTRALQLPQRNSAPPARRTRLSAALQSFPPHSGTTAALCLLPLRSPTHKN